MPEIPLFDIATVTPAELLAGLQSSSCVFLTGIAALGEPLTRMLRTAREFYGLSDTEKELVRWDGVSEWAGWQPLHHGEGPKALLLERYEFALPAPDGFADDAAWAACFGQWPEQPADFTAAWTAYYRSMRELASRLTSMLADALGVPATDVAAWTERQHSNLCVNHYLAQPDPPDEGRTRQHPHTDIGGITLLWADGRPGLEAQIGPEGSWVPVAFPPDALLLQAGDLLHLWSRGTIPANNHRVVNPPRAPGEPQPERYSVVYFHHPDLETWVAPAIPGADVEMVGTGALEHVRERQRKAYATTE
jgi:isopenicillin N synthase-like dioxygenase